MISAAPRLRVRALRAGVAEAAGEGAADLGGDADGASVFLAVGDVDGLSLLSVAEAEQEFAGIVLAGLHDGGFRAGDDEVVRQLLLQRAGDGGHAGEVGLAAVVDPVPELLGAEGRLAEVAISWASSARERPTRSRRPSASCTGGGSNNADLARIRSRSVAVRSSVALISVPGRPC